MSTLAFVLLLSIGLLLVLISIPLDLAFEINRTDRVAGVIRLRWLFGLVRLKFNLPSEDEEESPLTPSEGQKTKKPRKARKRKSKTSSANVLSALRQPALRKRAMQFIRDLFRATHARDLFLRLRIGLGDPADTGRLWGLVGPATAMVPAHDNLRVIIEPEFMDPVFEFQSRGRFRLIPIQFMALATAFILSAPVRQARRTLRRGNQ